MTPTQLNTAIRQRYNATNDDFWSDQEIYDYLYQGCLELANDCLLIERVFSTTSVVLQQEYDWPTNAISIKRVTYNGKKISPMTFRDDDILTYLNQTITSVGTPTNYAVFNNVMYLRPIPDTAALTIKVWAYVQPQEITVASTLELPVQYHMMLINFVVSQMSAKDKNYEGASYYQGLWEKDKATARQANAMSKRGDAFGIVQNADIIPCGPLGLI